MATVQQLRVKSPGSERCTMAGAGECTGATKPVVFSDGVGYLCSGHFAVLVSRLNAAASE